MFASTVREVRLVYADGPGRKIDPPVRLPLEAARIFRAFLGNEPVEVFGALMLNARHAVLAYQEISRGTLTASLVHPRDTFRAAVMQGAAAVIVAHNHPSGDAAPSAEDREVARRLIAAGDLLGIKVLDSLVIGDGNHSSLRELSPELFALEGLR